MGESMVARDRDERTLRLVAQWVRLIHECPYCAQCRKEIAGLTGAIPPVLVREGADAEWDHLTAKALRAFFDVLAVAKETQDDGH